MKTYVSTKLTDEALMTNFRDSHNSQYFELIVSRYKSRLYSVAFNLLGNDCEAEEIVQEAFIRVWRNCHNFKNNATFAGWIFTIMQNLCKDIWRTRRRKKRYAALFFDPLLVQEQEEVGTRRIFGHLPNNLPEADKHVENAEFKDFITQCLEQLPNNQKQVVILRDIEGHSYKKIALLTGASVGTVRSRLYYGRQKLKELIK